MTNTQECKWAKVIEAKHIETACAKCLEFLEKERSEDDLLEDVEFLSLIVTVKEPERKASNKAHRLPLKHSIYACDDQEICLFVKDPEDDLREKLDDKKIEGMTEVMGLTRLRNEYRSSRQKRELSKQYALFLADERIIPMLPQYLGKIFFLRKKHPFKVRVTSKDLPERICKLRDSTYLHTSKGPTRLIKVGRSNWKGKQIADNIKFVLDALPISMTNISSVSVKTSKSPNFPIFQLTEVVEE